MGARTRPFRKVFAVWSTTWLAHRSGGRMREACMAGSPGLITGFVDLRKTLATAGTLTGAEREPIALCRNSWHGRHYLAAMLDRRVSLSGRRLTLHCRRPCGPTLRTPCSRSAGGGSFAVVLAQLGLAEPSGRPAG